jgi:hypothetical protein
MTTRDAVLRALGKKPPLELNYELVDQADIIDIVDREREDVELLERTLKEGRENLIGGRKLRPDGDVNRYPNPASSCRFKRELTDSLATVTHKPRLIHAMFLISLLTIAATSLFTLSDSMSLFEIVYRAHALAGVRSKIRDPPSNERIL